MFFIVLTNLFVFTNQLTFLFPPSVHTVFSYMCVCVCVSRVHTVYVQSDLLEVDQLFVFFYQIWCVTVVILLICIYQVIFSPLVISAIYLMSISIFSFSLFTCHSAALYASRNNRGTYFFCTVTIIIYISN